MNSKPDEIENASGAPVGSSPTVGAVGTERYRFRFPSCSDNLAKELETGLNLSSARFNRPPPALLTPGLNGQTKFPEHMQRQFLQNLFGTSSMSGSPNFSESSGWSSSMPPTPTYYQDPFIRGEVPYEGNGRDIASFYGNFGVTSCEENARGNGPNPYLPRGIRNKVKFTFCVFCKKNGEDERFYLSHTLKDDNGWVTCPILYAYTCPKCSATGRVSHTIKYCPKTREEKNEEVLLPINTLKTMRSSTGTRKFNNNGNGYSMTSYPPSHPNDQGRLPVGKFQGPNAAWTGMTNQAGITPMFGEIINSQNRDRPYGYHQQQCNSIEKQTISDTIDMQKKLAR